MREYVSKYAKIFKSLQLCKIELLRDDFVVGNARRIYFSKTRLKHSTNLKKIFFDVLQDLLFKSFYLIHFSSKRLLYVNFDVNKKFEFDAIVYYVKEV